MRRGDPPARGQRTVARSVEDRVGVGLVLRGGHRDAPVKQFQHLVLDVDLRARTEKGNARAPKPKEARFAASDAAARAPAGGCPSC